MAGMITSIARILRSGNATLAEMAERLGISREQLADRLALMERQGYILRQPGMSESATCSCGPCCASCRTPGSRQIPAIIMLTEKGERLAGDKIGDSQFGAPDRIPERMNGEG